MSVQARRAFARFGAVGWFVVSLIFSVAGGLVVRIPYDLVPGLGLLAVAFGAFTVAVGLAAIGWPVPPAPAVEDLDDADLDCAEAKALDAQFWAIVNASKHRRRRPILRNSIPDKES